MGRGRKRSNKSFRQAHKVAAVQVSVQLYMTGKHQKRGIDFFLLKSLVLVQYHQTRMTLSFPTVPSAPPSESEKCRFNNVNGSHLTAHSFGVESQARARSR